MEDVIGMDTDTDSIKTDTVHTVTPYRTSSVHHLYTAHLLHCTAVMEEVSWEELLTYVNDPTDPKMTLKQAFHTWDVMRWGISGPSCPAGAGLIRNLPERPPGGPSSPFGSPYQPVCLPSLLVC